MNIKGILAFSGLGALIYLMLSSKSSNVLVGGKGDDIDESDVDQDEFQKGLQVEMEHTSNKKIAREIALDHLAEDPKYYTKLEGIHTEQNPKKKTAARANEKLWEQSKKAAIKKLGSHSARAMQLAVKIYKSKGGKYLTKKRSDNDLATWTRADWQYGGKNCDRYLPKAAWKKLSPAEKRATCKKKKGKMGRWVKNTKKAARAAKTATKKVRKK